MSDHRVMIVEDEFLVAMELEALLTRSGWDVIGLAPSLDRAMGMLRNGKPDVALLDVNLKGERVTPLAVHLKNLGIPYILITGYSRQQLGDRNLSEAPSVQKPVNHRELLRVLENAVRSEPDA